MREILFRGKVINFDSDRNGKWVFGQLVVRPIHDNGFDKCFICETGHQFIRCLNKMPCTYEVDPDTVGQYTGLTDKNGKRIFEGDVVKAADTDDPDLVGEIVLNMFSWLVSGSNWSDSLFRANEVHALEVIGNVHDNPELSAEVEG